MIVICQSATFCQLLWYLSKFHFFINRAIT